MENLNSETRKQIELIEEILGLKFNGITQQDAEKFIKKHKKDIEDYCEIISDFYK